MSRVLATIGCWSSILVVALAMMLSGLAMAEPPAPPEPSTEPSAEADGESDMDDIDVPIDDFQSEEEVITIKGTAPRSAVSEASIKVEDSERIAGTQGDPVKAVQTLGGVARPTVGSSGIVVWGASPANTRLLVDGVPVPRLFHLGGSRSILPSSMVSSVTLIPGGFSAPFGRAIGGLVQIKTAQAPREQHAVHASVDPFDVGVGARMQVGDSTSGAVAVRRGLLNDAFDALGSERARELVPIPSYWDYQAMARHRLANGDRLEVLTFGAHDRVVRGIPSVTPDSIFSEDSSSSFHRVSVRLLKQPIEMAAPAVAVWFGVDDERTSMMFGDVEALSATRAVQMGLRLSEERFVTDNIMLRTGLDFEFQRASITRDGALSLPAREGDIGVFGQPPGDRVNSDAWIVHSASVGAYVSSAFKFLDGRWTLEPGLRLEPSVIDGDRVVPVRPVEPAVGYTESRLALDPRLEIRYRHDRRFTVYAASGRYHQAPSPSDLSPVFGSPVLEPSQAWHALAGLIVSPRPWLNFELIGFAVTQSDLAVRSQLATPPLAGLLTSEGTGRNSGGQLSVRARPRPNLFAWLSYSLSRAQRRDHVDAAWRLFDADQTHVLQAVASWQHASGFEVGGRLGVSSGAPRTPVIGAVFNAGAGRYDPVFGGQNSVRIPMFMELSARVAWSQRVRWGRYKVWLDVQNLSNRDNPEEVFYNSDFSEQGSISGLPILPFIGAQVQR